MIELQLSDGRILTFSEEPPARRRALTPWQEHDITGVRSDERLQSSRLKRGPDFLITNPTDPNSELAVEVKLGTKPPEHAARSLTKLSNELQRDFGRNIPLQLWLLPRDAGSLRVLEVDQHGNAHGERLYHLTNVASQEADSADAVLASSPKLDTEYLTRRADNWEVRVHQLYGSVQEWCAQTNGELVPQIDGRVTMWEDLMKRYAVTPRELPVLQVFVAGTPVLTFKPYGLWVIGANGRIDLFARSDSYFLVDRSEPFAEPRWQLFGSGSNRLAGYKTAEGVPWTVESFQALVRA